MAKKHLVKCLYCGLMFDTNLEPFVKPTKQRYAHAKCYQDAKTKQSQEDKDKEALEKYIMNLFGVDFINARIQKQIKEYIKTYNYTYSGMLRSLEYFYGIKKNNIEKANGGLGIIPYIYQEAYNYYYTLWLANQRNEHKDLQEYYNPEIHEVKISIPKKKIKKRKIFAFLDEEEDINNEQ